VSLSPLSRRHDGYVPTRAAGAHFPEQTARESKSKEQTFNGPKAGS